MSAQKNKKPNHRQTKIKNKDQRKYQVKYIETDTATKT